MNRLYRVYARTYQKITWLAMWLLPWRQNRGTLSGAGSLQQLPAFLQDKGLSRVLIVTDEGLYKLGMTEPLLAACKAAGMHAAVYHEVVPNPTIGNIEEGVTMYRRHGCDVIVALGGGSAMDCAKGMAARLARPKKSIPQMKGQLKVLRQTPPVVAVPTTSGTGSEATLAAVVSNPATREKYAINDPMLIPRYVVMDPELTIGLPPHITATTGMDALTHAVEAYIGHSNTAQTKRDAIAAVQAIHACLYAAYTDGTNLEARNRMQQAAYLAGKAFTRAYVGYVHAVAHTLGGFYGVPHGLANAVILPHVLRAYGVSAQRKLAQLADCIDLAGNNEQEKAQAFIRWIDELNSSMNIPDKVRARDGGRLIQEQDLPAMLAHAVAEANPLYPCPQVWGKRELERIYRQIM